MFSRKLPWRTSNTPGKKAPTTKQKYARLLQLEKARRRRYPMQKVIIFKMMRRRSMLVNIHNPLLVNLVYTKKASVYEQRGRRGGEYQTSAQKRRIVSISLWKRTPNKSSKNILSMRKTFDNILAKIQHTQREFHTERNCCWGSFIPKMLACCLLVPFGKRRLPLYHFWIGVHLPIRRFAALTLHVHKQVTWSKSQTRTVLNLI